MGATVRRSIDIAAPPQSVWTLISDLPGMGRFSPENRGGRWKDDRGPVTGAVFRGRNGGGLRSWSTTVTVTRSEPGVAFAFRVTSVGLPVADWSYELAPAGNDTTLTEQWADRRGRLMHALGAVVSGVQDREGFTAKSIEQTLERVKAAAEGTAPQQP